MSLRVSDTTRWGVLTLISGGLFYITARELIDCIIENLTPPVRIHYVGPFARGDGRKPQPAGDEESR